MHCIDSVEFVVVVTCRSVRVWCFFYSRLRCGHQTRLGCVFCV